MTVTRFIPTPDLELRAEKKTNAALIRRRKILSILGEGRDRHDDDLDDPMVALDRVLDALLAIAVGDEEATKRLTEARAVSDAVALVEADIDTMDRATLDTFRPETSQRWPAADSVER